MMVPRRGLANVPAPGYASDAAAPEPAAVDELTNINFTDVIHDKGHIKLPVFIYCVPGDERAKYADTEEKLKHQVLRTAGRCVMRVLDVKAHPDLAQRLHVAPSAAAAAARTEHHPRWPVILAYSRGQEARRVSGHVSDRELTDWVHEESWLLNE